MARFPCGDDGEKQQRHRDLHQQYGLDLLVAGHSHNQEMRLPDMACNHMGGLTSIITGVCGGITFDATPNEHDTDSEPRF